MWAVRRPCKGDPVQVEAVAVGNNGQAVRAGGKIEAAASDRFPCLPGAGVRDCDLTGEIRAIQENSKGPADVARSEAGREVVVAGSCDMNGVSSRSRAVIQPTLNPPPESLVGWMSTSVER